MYSCMPRNIKTRNVILRYILTFSEEHGRQPSVREISEAAGLLSTSTTAGYLRRMANEGLLIRTKQKKRNYYLSQSAMQSLRKAS